VTQRLYSVPEFEQSAEFWHRVVKSCGLLRKTTL
jgi:hypothetical protein